MVADMICTARSKLRSFPHSGPAFGRPEHRLQREPKAKITVSATIALGPRLRGDERR